MVLLAASSEGLLRTFHDVQHRLRNVFAVQSTFRKCLSATVPCFKCINLLGIGIHWQVRIVCRYNQLTLTLRRT
ncbi:hypothetical protein CSX04_08366 [Burkholderia cepacia]|nr:hypothetical protein CSX04_08366 [Burkholderia cepacia]